LTGKGENEAFTAVHALDFFESLVVNIAGSPHGAAIQLTGMPGKHVPDGLIGTANDFLGAVPPTNGWMMELGRTRNNDPGSFECGYRIYISGDTLFVDDLKEIPKRYAGQNIDLMLVHLGGTTIPSPKLPLLMVTMDAEQGLKLIKLIDPDITIPIHYEYVSMHFVVVGKWLEQRANSITVIMMSSSRHSMTSKRRLKKLGSAIRWYIWIVRMNTASKLERQSSRKSGLAEVCNAGPLRFVGQL
jgi:hypothetical protein